MACVNLYIACMRLRAGIKKGMRIMAKKTIQIKKEQLEKLSKDLYDIKYTEMQQKRDLEEDVDDAVKELLKPIYGRSVVAKKTGQKFIDDQIPAYHGDSGSGKPDVMIYNFFWRRRNICDHRE